MKKITVFVMIMVLMLSVASCSGKHYRGPFETYGRFTVKLDEKTNAKEAMARYWKWSGDPNDTVISVPEYCTDDIRITAIGGLSKSGGNPRTPFEVEVDPGTFSHINATENSSPIDMVFTIEVGKDIQHVFFRSQNPLVLKDSDGQDVRYEVYYYFVCDPDNPTYYSKDGKLYSKRTNKLESNVPEHFYKSV